MAQCNLTGGATGNLCQYAAAGVSELLLINYGDLRTIGPFTDDGADSIMDVVHYVDEAAISAITGAALAQVTTVLPHGYQTGDIIWIRGVVGMVEVNDLSFTLTVVDSLNFTLDATNSTGYTAYVSGGKTTTKKWFDFTPEDETGKFKSSLQVNASKFFLEEIEFQLSDNSVTARTQMEFLGLGKVIALIKTQAGNYRIFGWTNGHEAETLDEESGGAAADFAGFTVKLSANENFLPKEFDAADYAVEIIQF